MQVFSKNMNTLDPKDPAGALQVIQRYIGYMQESVNFSVSGLDRRLREVEKKVKELEKVAQGGTRNGEV